MQCEFTTSSPGPSAHAQLFVDLSDDSVGISPCQDLFILTAT